MSIRYVVVDQEHRFNIKVPDFFYLSILKFKIKINNNFKKTKKRKEKDETYGCGIT